MDTHIIPVLEETLHTLSESCTCQPVMEVGIDGHITYLHLNLMNDHLIDRLDVL